jgi:hypothetical protein
LSHVASTSQTDSAFVQLPGRAVVNNTVTIIDGSMNPYFVEMPVI